jgi:NTE family protein
MLGLVLTGGGARAAYQAGVLRGIAEIAPSEPLPFQVLTGVSAGALNGVAIAASADRSFRESAEKLWSTWESLVVHDVFRTDAASLLGIGTRWVRDLGLGGFLGHTRSSYLLDTSPLREVLTGRIDFAKVREHVDSGRLRGVAVSATNYFSGTAVTFFDAHQDVKPWFRSTRIAKRTRLELEHVLASAAIPVFFPPVRVGGSHYGDGCIRLSAPLSPAIHLGADRILAIGIRYSRSQETTVKLNEDVYPESLSLVNIVGVLLNAVFLDSLEADLERLERINRTIQLLDQERRGSHPDQLRHIPILAIKPSRDLGSLASEQFQRFPRALRHLLRGLGASDDAGWDLLSYLAFDSAYTGRLLSLGYDDAVARRDEISRFLAGDAPATAP